MWANGFGKSYIQKQVELIQERANFAKEINTILEKYTISDGVFGIVRGNTCELSTGYFVESKTFDTIDEAVREMEQSNQAVRITDNKFILGNTYESLCDVPEGSKIFSIEFLDDVEG